MESETDNEVNTLDDLIGGQEVDVGTDVDLNVNVEVDTCR